MQIDNGTSFLDDLQCTAPDALLKNSADVDLPLLAGALPAADFDSLVNNAASFQIGPNVMVQDLSNTALPGGDVFDRARGRIQRELELPAFRVESRRVLADPAQPLWLRGMAGFNTAAYELTDIPLTLGAFAANVAIDTAELATKAGPWLLNLGSEEGWEQQVAEPARKAGTAVQAFVSDEALRGQVWDGIVSHAEQRPVMALSEGALLLTGAYAGAAATAHGIRRIPGVVNRLANEGADFGLKVLAYAAPEFDPAAQALLRTGLRNFDADLPPVTYDMALGKPPRGFEPEASVTYPVSVGTVEIHPAGTMDADTALINASATVSRNTRTYGQGDLSWVAAANAEAVTISITDKEAVANAAARLIAEGVPSDEAWFRANVDHRAVGSLVPDFDGVDGGSRNRWALHRFGPRLDDRGDPVIVKAGQGWAIVPDVPPDTAYLGRLVSGVPGGGSLVIETAKELAQGAGKGRMVAFTTSGTTQAHVYKPTGARVTDTHVNPSAIEVLDRWMADNPDTALPGPVFNARASRDPLSALHNLPLTDKLSAPDSVYRFGLEWDLGPTPSHALGDILGAPRYAVSEINKLLNPWPARPRPQPWHSDEAILGGRLQAARSETEPSKVIGWLDDKLPGFGNVWDRTADASASAWSAAKWTGGAAAYRTAKYGAYGAVGVAGYYAANGDYDIYRNEHAATAAYNVLPGSESISFVVRDAPIPVSLSFWGSPPGIRGSRIPGVELPWPLDDEHGLMPTAKIGPHPLDPTGPKMLSTFLALGANLGQLGFGIQVGNNDKGWRKSVALSAGQETVNLRLDTPLSGLPVPQPSAASGFTWLRPNVNEAFCYDAVCLVMRSIEITPQMQLTTARIPPGKVFASGFGDHLGWGGDVIRSTGVLLSPNPSYRVPDVWSKDHLPDAPTPFELAEPSAPAEVPVPAITWPGRAKAPSDVSPVQMQVPPQSGGSVRLDIEPQTKAPAGRDHRALPGESISAILRSSHPLLIGNFMRANGLTSSTIYAGRNYRVPVDMAALGDAWLLGQSALDADNARLATLRRTR